jgi:RNA recognition motif-containing protein
LTESWVIGHCENPANISYPHKLFIGGLSWDTDDSGLRAAFEPYGEVREAKVITDRDTGRSRGFGFVTYSNSDDATKAIEAQNGATLDGRTLRVDVAQDKGRGGAAAVGATSLTTAGG